MKPILLTMIVGGIMCICVSPTMACMCENDTAKATITRLRKSSATIFEGEVRSVTREFENGRIVWKATIAVSKLWKGPDAAEITVFTEGGCAAWFEVGRAVLVYAAQIDGRLSTNVCMRTGVIEQSTEDLKRLGKPNIVRTRLRVLPEGETGLDKRGEH